MNKQDEQLEALKGKAAEDLAKPKKIELRAGPPTYPAPGRTVEEARAEIAKAVACFLQTAETWWPLHLQEVAALKEQQDRIKALIASSKSKVITIPPELNYEIKITPPPVKGICTPTGSSKTQIAAKLIAADRKARRLAGDTGPMATYPWLYTVSLHRVSEAVADLFREGLTARVVYGREQWDRSIPGNAELPEDKRALMCLENPEKIKMVIACRQSVITTCCEGFPPRKKGQPRRKSSEKQRCPFRDRCPWWKQFEPPTPDVWVVAHNALFHHQKEFKKIAGIIIDESFYETGLYGIAKIKTREDEEPGFNLDDIAEKEAPHRDKLIELLRTHPMGGLRRDHFDGEINEEDCRRAILDEYAIADRLKITPQMTPAQFEHVKQDAPVSQRARHMVPVWGALRELLESLDIEVSGRLVLTQNKKTGKIYLRARGVRGIVEDRKVPTLLLDATLPDLDEILQKFFPQMRAEDITNIDVDVPEHVHIVQVIGAPVAIKALFGTKKKPAVGEQNLKAVRRFIQKWWLEKGRKEMLVICQQQVEGWLKDTLPPEIKVEHYNNTRGLDIYRLVPSMLEIGKTSPPPASVEAQAGALSGREPSIKMRSGQPGQPDEWYPQVARAIRMADGTGILVERCDQHPDPLCEALRWQACEAEAMQSLGRTRWINRDGPDKALTIGIVHNAVLPVTVSEVMPWQTPSAAVEMPMEDGFVLTSPTDIAKAWPGTTVRAAKWILKGLRALAPAPGAGTEDIFSMGGRSAGTEDIFSKGYIPIEIMSSVPMLAFLYQRHGPKQKLHWGYFDPSRWPNPRAWVEQKLGELVRLLLPLKHEIPPMAGASKVGVNAEVLKAAERAPRKPLTTPAAEAYSSLPLELRLLALGLHETKGSGEYINKQ